MRNQTKVIKQLDWDILIILDACRYDKFMKYHQLITDNVTDYSLEPVSTGKITFTRLWLYTTWGDKKYDSINYISANGFVNSKGIVVTNDSYPFNAKKHFGKIQDVWDYGYDYNTRRVEPWTMAKYSKKLIDPSMKNIVHFQQPHAPYLFEDGSSGGFRNIDKIRNREEAFKRYTKKQSGLQGTVKNGIRIILQRYAPHTFTWMLSDIFPFIENIAQDRRKYRSMWKTKGRKKIIEAYERNLYTALPHVLDIIQAFPQCKIIVTADHAERLGEFGRYGHGGKPDKLITTVPFLTIYSSESAKTKKEQDSIKSVIGRLKHEKKIKTP